MKYLSLLFFPLAFVYEELLLRFGAGMSFTDSHMVLIAAFSAVYGLMTWLLVSLLRSDKARAIAASASLFLTAAVVSTEYTVYSFFKTFFDCSYMLSMGAAVTTQFADDTIASIISALPLIALSFVPPAAFWLLRKWLLPGFRLSRNCKMAVLAGAVVLDILLIVPMVLGSTFKSDRDHFLYDYTASGAIPRFGVVTSVRMEATYAVLGTPVDFLVAPEEPVVTPEPEPEGPVEYGYNVSDIDFAALSEAETDKTLKSMHSYFAGLAPTQQNEYTGMFAGKNLVYLVCEAFSPYAIDPELTPTLYKLSTEGFVFTNFYQPDWTMSTTGGEYAAVTGLIPTWVNGKNSFYMSQYNNMAYSLARHFTKLGYTANAYHNHYGEYYSRDKTHPNLGYDFKAINLGLKLSGGGWPRSDLEMMQKTINEHIDAYVNQGQSFHVYYMTVSGHTPYDLYGQKQAKKHQDEVAHLDASDPVKAYIACQLEVEYALTCLIEQLEAAGIADDTVIALTADHYPYALTNNFAKDYYRELSGKKTTEQDIARYENEFLLWCSSMEDPVVIDDPGSAIDILPTLCNLFGIEYDSRLYSGRDLLATNYDVTDPNSRLPFVVFPDNGNGYSWVSPIGEYNANKSKKKFTPYEGYESYAEDTEYLEAMHKKAKNMFKNAKRIIAEDYYGVVVD